MILGLHRVGIPTCLYPIGPGPTWVVDFESTTQSLVRHQNGTWTWITVLLGKHLAHGLLKNYLFYQIKKLKKFLRGKSSSALKHVVRIKPTLIPFFRAPQDVVVRSAHRQDSSVIIQWDSETANILGFRVVYRLFGDKSFKQGPPLEASEREFKIKNVPSQVSKFKTEVSLLVMSFNTTETISWAKQKCEWCSVCKVKILIVYLISYQ